MRLPRPALLAFGKKARRGIAAAARGRAMLGGDAARVTPMIESARVVNTPQLFVLAISWYGKAKRTPTLLPTSWPASLHPLRPARQLVGRTEFHRILGERKIHRDVALLDQRTGAPAAAIDHLLVGQNRLVHRVPLTLAIFLYITPFSNRPGEQPCSQR